MKTSKKVFILSFSLLLPLIIYLFLRIFGENKYEVPVIENSCDLTFGNLQVEELNESKLKLIDIRSGDNNILIDNYINKILNNKNIFVITLSHENRYQSWTHYNVNKSFLEAFYNCNNLEGELSPFIVLLDKKNIMRGLYDPLISEDIDRLNVEIDILRLSYEK